MKNIGEFDFINSICKMFGAMPDNGFEGIGDDCAVLPIGGGESLLFTSDMLNEGVHFLADRSTPYQVGYKSLMVNISDVAAMGAKPVATLLSLALPASRFGDWATEFMRGYRDASAKFNVALVGGDTTKSSSGISISVTAIGRASNSNLKRRSAARVGDDILVTGTLGASAAGLRDVLNGIVDTPNAIFHLQPEAQVCEGEWLGSQSGVHAMMDVSDGIAADLRHITEESVKGAVLYEKDIPISENATLADAMGGGEDYKLLFTADCNCTPNLMRNYEEKFGVPIYKIGRIVDSSEVLFERVDGSVCDLALLGGFTHF